MAGMTEPLRPECINDAEVRLGNNAIPRRGGGLHAMSELRSFCKFFRDTSMLQQAAALLGAAIPGVSLGPNP